VTHEEIKHAITEGVKEAFQNPELHCRYRIASEQHDEDHRAIQQFMKNMGKISDIKFFVIRWAVIAILTLVAGWTGLGIVHSIRGG
jgi:hypothetical protein